MFEPFTFTRGETVLAGIHRKGLGLPLVLLHGLAGTTAEWGTFVDHLDPNIPIVALDLRGHGKSTRLPESATPEDFVSDCKHVLGALGVQTYVAVGQSMGGIVATLLTAEEDSAVVGLLLVDAGMKGHEPDEDLAPLRRWLETQEMDASLGITAIQNLNRTSRWDLWTRVGCPICEVVAERSLLSREEVGRMRHENGVAQFHVIKESGHDIHLDQPAALAEITMQFLDSVTSRPQ